MNDASTFPDLSIQWDGERFKMTVPVVLTKDLVGRIQDGDRIAVDLETIPSVIYVVRIRRVSDALWGPALITPFTSIQFEGLQPYADYEFEVIARHSEGGDSPPTRLLFTTNADGLLNEVIQPQPCGEHR